jgi:WD40 repeat protein
MVFRTRIAGGVLAVLFCCTSFFSGMVQAQKDKWILYPTEVDFDAGPSFSPVNFPNPSQFLTIPYYQENAVYDTDGSLLFYYQDGDVFNAQGVWAGSNPYYIKGSSNGEAVILPVPGQCQMYCIFTIHTYPVVQFFITMQEVTVNPNGSLTVHPAGYLDGNPSINPLFGNDGSIGASKIIPGSVADRYVYVAVNVMEQVRRYKLTATGVAFDGIETFFTYNNHQSSELEIAPNGELMAWSVGNAVNLYDFVNLPTFTSLEGIVNGLEFSTDSKFLLASVEHKGIAVISTSPPYAYSYIPNSLDFEKTYLEAGKDGRIYCVHRAGFLYAIEADLSTLTAMEAIVYSIKGSIMTRGYTLPDQIDGEGDEFFYGVPPLSVQNLSIDQLTLPESVGGAIPAFYNCDNIDLEIDYSGTPVSYSVSIYSVDPLTGIQVSGPPFLDYFDTFAGAPPAAIDLRCIDDPVNCDLFSGYFAQTFAVEVAINGRCTTDSRKGYFKVFDAPNSPVDIEMEVQPGIGICLPAHDPSSPCFVGLYSAAIRLSNSSGDITFYRIVIDETDCATGQVIQNIYPGPFTPINSAFALPIHLNALEIDGSMGYFVLNNFIGRCIRVTAEVGNNCGSSSDFSYMYFDGYYLDGGSEENLFGSPPTGSNGDAWSIVTIFPNPAREAWNIRFTEPPAEDTAISVADATGRTVHRLQANAGATEVSIPAADLPSGAYYYRIFAEGEAVSGILLKQ